MNRDNDWQKAFETYSSPELASLKAGDTLLADDGFTCINAGAVLAVMSDENGLYVSCSDGRHYLDGQLQDGGTLAGLVKLPAVSV